MGLQLGVLYCLCFYLCASMMCCGDLFPRDRSEPNHDRNLAESRQPVSTQPHSNQALQLPLLTGNLPPEESPGNLSTRDADSDQITMANNAVPYRSSRSASDSSPSWRKELAGKLRDSRLECRDRGDFIIPKESLNRLITASVIERAIMDENPATPRVDARRQVERIEKSAKKLFGIYGLRAHGATLRFLLDTDLSDNDLPLTKYKDTSGWCLSKRGPQRKIEAFDDWENDIVDDFARPQWSMIAPFFDRSKLECHELEDERVLPFFSIPMPQGIDDGIPHAKVGGYGEVNAYRIHPEYHNFWPVDASVPFEYHPLIAVKELLHKDLIEFLKEKTILVALGAEPHPHLIQLLGSYRKLRSYHLIFPCADANLRAYWSNNPVPQFTRETALWSIQQMAGIADGLDRIHGFKVVHDLKVEPHLYTPVSGRKYKLKAGEEKFGRHGDIKAENLLWFKEENVLKITDFGLGRFHGRYSRSRIDPRGVVSPMTYEPPECTIGRHVSRKYDIWSMGCLYLEFVTWLLAGNEKIGDFSDERGNFNPDSEVNDDNFFAAYGDERDPEVRDSVVQWVKGLHAHKNCSRAIHALLDLVMDHMLKVDPDERIEASDLKARMHELASKATASNKYLTQPDPRPMAMLSPS